MKLGSVTLTSFLLLVRGNVASHRISIHVQRLWDNLVLLARAVDGGYQQALQVHLQPRGNPSVEANIVAKDWPSPRQLSHPVPLPDPDATLFVRWMVISVSDRHLRSGPFR
jgi:hypothetical protein